MAHPPPTTEGSRYASREVTPTSQEHTMKIRTNVKAGPTSVEIPN